MSAEIIEPAVKTEMPILCSLLEHYYDEFAQYKEVNQSLDNLNFHRQFGLSISAPDGWPVMKAIGKVVTKSIQNGKSNIIIIYPSTADYRDLADTLNQVHPLINFFAWHELYVAIDRAGKDARDIKRFRNMLENSHLTIFYGAPTAIPEVLDQVRGYCEGCLIILN